MENIKSLCSKCRNTTNHAVLAQHKLIRDSSDGEIQWRGTYQIIQCLGCDDIVFRCASMFTEDHDPSTGQPIESVQLYPDPAVGRQPMNGHEAFPLKIARIYMETLNAVNNQTPILAAIGLRILIESICLEQKTKADKLTEGIDELVEMGLLSKKQAEFLHINRFMGNQAASEVVAPKPQSLIAALDIAENLLKTVYILPDMTQMLKRS